MANKLVISIVSLVLVVGAVLGVVAVIVKSGGDSDKNVSTSTKNSVCKPTEYPDACHKVLADVDKNSSATHEDYIIASIRATADELRKSLEKASNAKKEKDKDSPSHRDLESCEKMLGYATDELQQVLKVVSETEVTSIVEQIDPILVWLTAVRAYQTTCVDEIRDEKLKKDMQQGLETSNELTFNAQKIFYNVIDIFKDIGVELGDLEIPSTGQRKLLDELHEIEHSGFPSWVPTTDRKLLGAKRKAKKAKGGKAKGGKGKGQAIFKTPPPPPLPPTVTPNAIVAQDGSGKFKGIKQALAAYPPNHQGRYIIYIKAGVYNEGQIIIDKTQNNVFMYGDGREKTIITGSLNFAIQKIGTSQTATVAALGERFMAKGICFRNTIGPAGHQAVAFRSQSPHTVMMDCSFEGYQDTLYYHTHDQFYKNCAISGTVDFIFGTGRAFIQDSQIFVNKPDKNQANMVTADGRMKMEEAGGVVLHNCKIMASAELAPQKAQFATYLGRPWKPSATSVIMLCDIGDMIRPEGWTQWESPEGKNNHMTCMFREYGNKGPGSNTAGRVKWPSVKVIQNQREAIGFTAGTFMPWLPQYGVPANLGL